MADLSKFLQRQVGAVQAKEKKGKGYERKLNWKDKREIKREKQQKEEEEQITKGVSSAIPSTNIGFKMLQQMGYNPGLALGKHGQGMLEPVGIDIKRSRTGLGRDDVVNEMKISKAKELERNTENKRINVQEMVSEFEERQKQLWLSRKTMAKYKKASAALAHLEGNSRPGRDGKQKIQEDVDEAEEDEEEVTAESIWDINGKDKNDKRKKGKKKKQIKSEKQQKDEEEKIRKDLQKALNRLRGEFNYCIYCGCQYESADVMLSNCPGLEEEDH